MSKTVTLSFASPIDLAIQMDVYMETKGLNRSQLIKAALVSFLDLQKKKETIPEALSAIHKEILDIKKILKKEVLRPEDT
jgi:metal-responsive CopG/Arc/MetJ family transcriptional regulator